MRSKGKTFLAERIAHANFWRQEKLVKVMSRLV